MALTTIFVAGCSQPETVISTPQAEVEYIEPYKQEEQHVEEKEVEFGTAKYDGWESTYTDETAVQTTDDTQAIKELEVLQDEVKQEAIGHWKLSGLCESDEEYPDLHLIIGTVEFVADIDSLISGATSTIDFHENGMIQIYEYLGIEEKQIFGDYSTLVYGNTKYIGAEMKTGESITMVLRNGKLYNTIVPGLIAEYTKEGD